MHPGAFWGLVDGHVRYCVPVPYGHDEWGLVCWMPLGTMAPFARKCPAPEYWYAAAFSAEYPPQTLSAKDWLDAEVTDSTIGIFQ